VFRPRYKPITILPASHVECASLVSLAKARSKLGSARPGQRIFKLSVAAGILLFAICVSAQGTPKITKVDPASGKVNDTLTISGEALGKGSVAAIFLSDDKSDYKATMVSQSADTIVMKVPQVKPGGYNVSIQVGGGILIEPVRFTVEQ